MSNLILDSAREDFKQARRRAALQQVLAGIRGESVELLSFEAVHSDIEDEETSELGLQDIPLDAIVGSVGRYQDFTSTFLPRSDEHEERWTRIRAYIEHHGYSPIKVYQLGATYFVIDGNHRVSVARQMGSKTIQAYVTKVEARVPPKPGDSPEEILRKARYAEFLEKTNLDRLRPKSSLFMTIPGHYHVLLEQIEAKRYLMDLDPRRADVSYEDAVIAWHDRVYTPMLHLIRQQGLQRRFPGLSETDLYVLVLKHRKELREQLGWNLDTVAVASDLARRKSSSPGKVVDRVGEQVSQAITPDALEGGPAPGNWREERLAKRPSENLFAEILVAGQGVEADYNMVRHAALVAKRENGRLLALRVVENEAEASSDRVKKIRTDFERFCQEKGIPGEFATDTGRAASILVERAALADLLVLSLLHQTGQKTATGFGTDVNKILQRSPRPVLVVPEGADSNMDRALLAYDGSRKADEALFLSTYLARNWPLSLIVLSAGEKQGKSALDRARSYLTLREVEATYVQGPRPAATTILKTAAEQNCNLIIMGGFGHRPVLQIVIGSTVNKVLQRFRQPILICR